MQLIRKRNALFQKAKRSKEISHFAQYKEVRNRVVNFVRSGRHQYFNSLASADNKIFWKSVKLLNKNRESIPTVQQGDCIASSGKEKADM